MGPDPPRVCLGTLADDGVAPGLFALVERGVAAKPALARSLSGEVALHFDEGFAPVRVVFGADEILIEDGEGQAPDVVVSGRLPDVLALTVTPKLGGLPSPMARRGRTALGNLATGRVRITGRRMLARKLLALMEVEV